MKRVRTIWQAGPVGKSCEYKKFIGSDDAVAPKGIAESCRGVMACRFCESEGCVVPGESAESVGACVYGRFGGSYESGGAVAVEGSGGLRGPDGVGTGEGSGVLRGASEDGAVAPGGGGAASAFPDSKPHYLLLDGLRGVAALVVVWYHIFEAFAASPVTQRVNHGFLAVDFFYILSGFVIGYAYNDRWKKGLSTGRFFKRRLIRLHPMVVLSCVLGMISFCIQGCEQWDGSHVAFSLVLLAFLMQLFMIPVWPGASADIRGGEEMYPLNGPSWSLFFEYIGNLLYALFLRRLSTRQLAVFTAMAGVGLAAFALYNLSGTGNLGVGWTLAGYNFPGGMLRMTFSFSAGLLLSRTFRPHAFRRAFPVCAAALVLLLAMPYIGDGSRPWTNAIYELFCIMGIFPLLVWIAASGKATGRILASACRFLGDISYPLYIIHYPSIYLLFMASRKYGMTFQQAWPYALVIFAGNILLAWILLKIYDEPVRSWLTRTLRKH